MQNQYSTRQHRLNTLHLRSKHQNRLLRANAVGSLRTKLKDAHTSFITAKSKLESLLASDVRYTPAYFADQWAIQRKLQLSAMEDQTVCALEESLIELLDLEEKLRDAQSQAEQEQLLTLPTSIVAFEEAIASVVADLGHEEFRNLEVASNPKARGLIRVRMAKQKLYKAKVGILEAQKQWEKYGQGTRVQQSLKQFMRNKQNLFKRKFESFKLQVSKYNSIQPLSDIPCPIYNDAKSIGFEDPFWDMGSLLHPTEAWAVDPGTKEGIQAFLTHRSCSEELRRISREIRQMIVFALKTDEMFDHLQGLSVKEWDPEASGRDSPIDLIQPGGRHAKDVWDESRTVLSGLHMNIRQSFGRDFMGWNTHMVQLLQETHQYSTSTSEWDDMLAYRWVELIVKCKSEWEKNVNASSLEAEALDDQDALEQTMLLWGEEEEEIKVPNDELKMEYGYEDEMSEDGSHDDD
ncbi:hypothetical protein DFH28DRAFT_914130 [Melampsora americana]|nr:hypothetical protein DFH28DRAFT_914130 [Melampsora americana]